MAHKFEVGIIEFFEDCLIAPLVWMAFQSCLPEGLLYHFFIRREAALLLGPQYRTQLGKSCVRENFEILMMNI